MSEQELDIYVHQYREWLARRQKDLAGSWPWYREFFGDMTFRDIDPDWKARRWTPNGPPSEAI